MMSHTQPQEGPSFPPSPNWYCAAIASCLSDRFLAFGARNSVILLDLRTQFTKRVLNGHKARVSCVDFVPNSTTLASCSADKTVILWNYITGSIQSQHKEHKAEVVSVSASKLTPGLVVSGDKDGRIVLWMPGGASSVSFRPVDSSQICALRLSPTDVDLIAIGYSSGLVALVHLRNGKVLFRCTTAHDEVQSLAFSPSGEFLAFSSKDKIITVIKLASTTTSIESQVLKTHKAGKNSGGDPRSWISLCWNESSVKDPEFWSSTPNGDIMTWNLDLHSTRLVHGHSRAIFQLLHLPSLNALISISMDRNIILWDVRKKTKIWDMSTLGGYVYAIAEHPLDPSLVALACGDNSIRIWFNQECISALEDEASGASKGQNQASKFSNGSSTISGSRLSTVLVWKGITGKVTCIQWHPANTNELAFGMADGTISIYNMTTQQCSPLQQRHQQTVYDIRYAPSGDGDRYAILSVGGESKVLVHDSSGASLKFQETAEAANPNYMALLSSGIGKTINSLPKRSGLDFSLTGDLVFLGNTDGSCELYSYPELKLLHCNRNHLKLVNKVRWNRCSADARFRQFAATASEDGAICIYNFALLPTFDPLVKTLAAKGRKRSVVDISWSPSNPNRLVAANSDGTVSYWDIDSEQETLASPQYHGKSKVISVLWSSTLEGNLIFSGSEDQSMAINHFRSHSYSLSETNSSPSSTVTNETSHGGSNSRMQGIREAVVHRQDYSRTSASASSIATTSFDSNTTSGGTKATKQRNAAAKSGSTSHATSQASGSHRLGGIHWNESENPLDTISQLLSTGKRDSAEQEGTWLPKPLSTSDGPSPDSIQQQFMLSYWKGDVAQTLLSVIHQGALNDMWVGLSASGGFELWKTVSAHYAEQLLNRGDIHRAVYYYLAIRDFESAIAAYESAGLFREAITLATERLPESHDRVASIWINWANHCAHRKQHDQASKCFAAVGDYGQALRQLRLCKSVESSLLALQVYHRFQQQPSARNHLLTAASNTMEVGQEALDSTESNWEDQIWETFGTLISSSNQTSSSSTVPTEAISDVSSTLVELGALREFGKNLYRIEKELGDSSLSSMEVRKCRQISLLMTLGWMSMSKPKPQSKSEAYSSKDSASPPISPSSSSSTATRFRVSKEEASSMLSEEEGRDFEVIWNLGHGLPWPFDHLSPSSVFDSFLESSESSNAGIDFFVRFSLILESIVGLRPKKDPESAWYCLWSSSALSRRFRRTKLGVSAAIASLAVSASLIKELDKHSSMPSSPHMQVLDASQDNSPWKALAIYLESFSILLLDEFSSSPGDMKKAFDTFYPQGFLSTWNLSSTGECSVDSWSTLAGLWASFFPLYMQDNHMEKLRETLLSLVQRLVELSEENELSLEEDALSLKLLLSNPQSKKRSRDQMESLGKVDDGDGDGEAVGQDDTSQPLQKQAKRNESGLDENITHSSQIESSLSKIRERIGSTNSNSSNSSVARLIQETIQCIGDKIFSENRFSSLLPDDFQGLLLKRLYRSSRTIDQYYRWRKEIQQRLGLDETKLVEI